MSFFQMFLVDELHVYYLDPFRRVISPDIRIVNMDSVVRLSRLDF